MKEALTPKPAPPTRHRSSCRCRASDWVPCVRHVTWFGVAHFWSGVCAFFTMCWGAWVGFTAYGGLWEAYAVAFTCFVLILANTYATFTVRHYSDNHYYSLFILMYLLLTLLGTFAILGMAAVPLAQEYIDENWYVVQLRVLPFSTQYDIKRLLERNMKILCGIAFFTLLMHIPGMYRTWRWLGGLSRLYMYRFSILAPMFVINTIYCAIGVSQAVSAVRVTQYATPDDPSELSAAVFVYGLQFVIMCALLMLVTIAPRSVDTYTVPGVAILIAGLMSVIVGSINVARGEDVEAFVTPRWEAIRQFVSLRFANQISAKYVEASRGEFRVTGALGIIAGLQGLELAAALLRIGYIMLVWRKANGLVGLTDDHDHDGPAGGIHTSQNTKDGGSGSGSGSGSGAGSNGKSNPTGATAPNAATGGGGGGGGGYGSTGVADPNASPYTSEPGVAMRARRRRHKPQRVRVDPAGILSGPTSDSETETEGEFDSLHYVRDDDDEDDDGGVVNGDGGGGAPDAQEAKAPDMDMDMDMDMDASNGAPPSITRAARRAPMQVSHHPPALPRALSFARKSVVKVSRWPVGEEDELFPKHEANVTMSEYLSAVARSCFSMARHWVVGGLLAVAVAGLIFSAAKLNELAECGTLADSDLLDAPTYNLTLPFYIGSTLRVNHTYPHGSLNIIHIDDPDTKTLDIRLRVWGRGGFEKNLSPDILAQAVRSTRSPEPGENGPIMNVEIDLNPLHAAQAWKACASAELTLSYNPSSVYYIDTHLFSHTAPINITGKLTVPPFGRLFINTGLAPVTMTNIVAWANPAIYGRDALSFVLVSESGDVTYNKLVARNVSIETGGKIKSSYLVSAIYDPNSPILVSVEGNVTMRTFGEGTISISQAFGADQATVTTEAGMILGTTADVLVKHQLDLVSREGGDMYFNTWLQGGGNKTNIITNGGDVSVTTMTANNVFVETSGSISLAIVLLGINVTSIPNYFSIPSPVLQGPGLRVAGQGEDVTVLSVGGSPLSLSAAKVEDISISTTSGNIKVEVGSGGFKGNYTAVSRHGTVLVEDSGFRVPSSGIHANNNNDFETITGELDVYSSHGSIHLAFLPDAL